MRNVITIMAVAGMTLVGASCNTAAVRQQEAAMKAQQATIDSMKIEMAKQQVIDSMNEVAKMNVVLPESMAPVTREAAAPVRHTVAKKRKTTRSRSVASNSGSTNHSNTNNYPAQSQTQTQPVYQEPAPVVTQAPEEKKKGWSAKAKGAVIGTGVGAAAGAIIGGKGNRAKGAIIGGIIGAAGGLGTGAVIDKKNGR